MSFTSAVRANPAAIAAPHATRVRARASAGQLPTARRASRRNPWGTGWSATMGYPHSSRVINSGRSSAHAPCPAQATGFTRSRLSMSTPVRVACGPPGWQRQERPRVGSGAPALLVQPGLGGEDAQGAADETHAAVRVVAGAAPGDQAGPSFQVGPCPLVGARTGEVVKGRRDPRQAVEA